MYFSFPLCQFLYNPYFVSGIRFHRKKRRMFLFLIPLLHKLNKAAFNLRHVVLQLVNQRVVVDGLVDVARLLHEAPARETPIGNRRAPHIGARNRLQKPQLRKAVNGINLPPQAFFHLRPFSERIAVDNLGKSCQILPRDKLLICQRVCLRQQQLIAVAAENLESEAARDALLFKIVAVLLRKRMMPTSTSPFSSISIACRA